MRKKQKNTPHPDDLYDTSQDLPIDRVAEKQTSDEILKELANLPEEQAKLLISAFYEDKTHAEIAEQNKLPLGTVKSRIRLGLQKMKEALGNKSLGFDNNVIIILKIKGSCARKSNQAHIDINSL